MCNFGEQNEKTGTIANFFSNFLVVHSTESQFFPDSICTVMGVLLMLFV